MHAEKTVQNDRMEGLYDSCYVSVLLAVKFSGIHLFMRNSVVPSMVFNGSDRGWAGPGFSKYGRVG